jgi:isopentenyl-diphosphate delta-isomerase
MQRAVGDGKALGRLLREWGVPTAASVIHARLARPRFQTIIATGGLTSGVDLARAIALGASAGGIARPVLQAFVEGGAAGAKAFLGRVRAELTAVMVLTGSRTLGDLARVDRILGPSLSRWENAAQASKSRKKAK